MKSRVTKVIAVLALVMMLPAVIGACTKDNGDAGGTATAAKTSSVAAASKTTVKSIAAASTAALTSIQTGGGTAEAAATQAAATQLVSDEAAGQEDDAQAVDGDESEDAAAENTDNEAGGNPYGIVKGKVDLGGKTILIGGLTAAYVPADTADKSTHYRLWAKVIKRTEEKYNCRFEFTYDPKGSATNMANSIMTAAVSGIKYVDICRISSSYQLPALAKSKAILPLDDIIDFETPILKNNKYLYDGSYWCGKHYGVLNEYKSLMWSFMYNKEVLDREGQPDILDLCEKNNWNWDTFLDITKNCTRDINSDGIVDQWGTTTTSNWYLTKYLLNSNGLTSGIEMTDSGPKAIIDSPAAMRTFQFIIDLSFVHKVVKIDSATTGVYMTGNCATMIYNWYAPNRTLIQKGVEVYMAPLPLGPDTTQYGNLNPSQLYVLSSVCENPVEFIQVFTEACILWNEDAMDYIPEFYTMEGSTGWEWYWSPDNANRWMTTQRESLICDFGTFPYYKPDFTEAFPSFATKMQTLIANPIMSGTKSVMQAIDSALPELQAIIDSVMQ